MLSSVSENTGGPSDSQNRQEQAETAIVTAYYPPSIGPLVPVLSTTYNDFSIGRTFEGQDEFEYPTPAAGSGLQYGDQRIIHRGASAMGWAWSLDGQSWTYGGKVRPPRSLPFCTYDAECPSGSCQGGQCTCPNGDSDCMAPGASCDPSSARCVANTCPSGTDADCAPGYHCTNKVCTQEPWAGIAGDPSMAVDPTNPYLVYAVQLGVSDASYNMAKDPLAPNVLFAIDGFCIARSANAGETFGAGDVSGDFPYLAGGRAYCQRVTPAHAPVTKTTTNVGVDKTAVAVDWRGRVWVATEDREAGSIAIFHNQDELDGWNRFTRVQTCTGSTSDAPDCIPQAQAQYVGQYEPVLRISPACRDFVDSPSCAFAPNASGSIFLESIHFDANGMAHLLQISFGADYDNTLKTCAGGPCPCTTSSDCGTGLICDSTSHRCGPPVCTTDQDCLAGWRCDSSLGGCVQPTSWGGVDLTRDCLLGTVGPAVAGDPNLLGVYGTTDPGDGPQDGAQSITDAFRHSFDIGVDGSGTAIVDRFAYLYHPLADPTQFKLQVGELNAGTGLCTTPPGWSTEVLEAVSQDPTVGEQIWPTLNWTDRSTPSDFATYADNAPSLEWQVGYLSNHRVVDNTKSYVSPWASTVGTQFGVPLLTDNLNLVFGKPNGLVTDSFPCPHDNGYWGDYFGLTQFPGLVPASFPLPNAGVPLWLNAASFTFSAHRPANAGDVCSVYQRQKLGAPMDIDAFTWPSIDPFP